jgi:DNA-directed RNA polymerase specialized sigma24 family protein
MNPLASGWPTVEIIERCSRRPADEIAWQEFVRRFHLTIRGSVMRAYRYKAEDEASRNLPMFEKTIDDLVQAVYCRLIESRGQVLKQFDLNQPDFIYRYLAIISYRVVFNHFRGVN